MIRKKLYQLLLNIRRKIHHATVLIQNKTAFSTFSFGPFLCFSLFAEKQKLYATNFKLILKYIHIYTATLPQVVFNSLMPDNSVSILYVFVWGVSAKISDLNFQASRVSAQLKKFTKMWTKAFVLLEDI